jgi:hypothetical protein
MHRTTVMLPDPLKLRIVRSSKQMHVSMGEFLRVAAEAYLEREEYRFATDPLVGDACILREPGAADVSANVDHYLYGRP